MSKELLCHVRCVGREEYDAAIAERDEAIAQLEKVNRVCYIQLHKIQNLRKQLAKFGGHAISCASHFNVERFNGIDLKRECNCGWDELRAALDGAKGDVE